MGIPVFIMGESGSGKTYSIRNMDPASVGVFLCKKAHLPFKNNSETGFKTAKHSTYQTVKNVLASAKLKSYVIDDSTFLMSDQYISRAKETGYQKYTDIGTEFANLIEFVVNKVPDDVIVYFLHHIQETNMGKVKLKTVGQLVDNYANLEAQTNIVLYAQTDGENYTFITQSNGSTTAKSPVDMFEKEIPNDLALVDKAIREYWEI